MVSVTQLKPLNHPDERIRLLRSWAEDLTLPGIARRSMRVAADWSERDSANSQLRAVIQQKRDEIRKQRIDLARLEEQLKHASRPRKDPP